MLHRWRLDSKGRVDTFAFEYENHNGAVCEVCDAAPCMFCEPAWAEEDDCPGERALAMYDEMLEGWRPL